MKKYIILAETGADIPADLVEQYGIYIVPMHVSFQEGFFPTCLLIHTEFLIYMVGYSEKDVVAYTRKLYKELKELPYGFGATIGYSMIMDDVKTVDDAINEATIDMRNKKENHQVI